MLRWIDQACDTPCWPNPCHEGGASIHKDPDDYITTSRSEAVRSRHRINACSYSVCHACGDQFPALDRVPIHLVYHVEIGVRDVCFGEVVGRTPSVGPTPRRVLAHVAPKSATAFKRPRVCARCTSICHITPFAIAVKHPMEWMACDRGYAIESRAPEQAVPARFLHAGAHPPPCQHTSAYPGWRRPVAPSECTRFL